MAPGRAPHWPGRVDRANALRRALSLGPQRGEEELSRFRDLQLRRLVAHGEASVPFHRVRFAKHGVQASEVRGVADLAALPITAKGDLQHADSLDLLSEGVDSTRLIERRTTGSTGQPLCIRRTWIEERILGAFRWRALSEFGARRRDRFVEIEEPLPESGSDDTAVHRLLQRLGFYRQRRIDALQLPERILDAVTGFEPEVVCGYAGVVSRVARVAAPRTGRVPRPRFVAVHSDTLTSQMRAAIVEGFSAPVFEIYDCNECNVVASECRETGVLHTSDDSVIVEVLRPDGAPAASGEVGEVVVTALHSFAMPLIRYRIGDSVVQGERGCACGSAFGSIRAVQGRMFDYFPLADGRTIHPYVLINILGECAPWIVEYRMLQKRRDRIELRFVAEGEPSEERVNEMAGTLREFLGPRIELDVGQVSAFESAGSAKLRVCRSLVASEYDGAGRADGGGGRS